MHVALIADGNGRWATQKGLPRIVGHSKGVSTVRAIVEACPELGVRCLTLWAFSQDNWNRPGAETSFLMATMSQALEREGADLVAQGVRVRFIGSRVNLPKRLKSAMERLEHDSRFCTTLFFQIAIGYSGRQDILEAARAFSNPSTVSAPDFDDALSTQGIPDPHLLVRTGGERRLSNFMLWQLAYTELVFLDTLWPDFSPEIFSNCLQTFRARSRRFGSLLEG